MPIVDKVYEVERRFKSIEEATKWGESFECLKFCREKFGVDFPGLFVAFIDTEDGKEERIYGTYAGQKNNIPMDWDFYSDLKEITAADIDAERNADKRTLLMMEYGVKDYLQDIEIIDEHPEFGQLIKSVIKGEDDDLEPQLWLVDEDPQPISKEKRDFLRKRDMLSSAGNEMVYIPVPPEMETAKQAAAWSFEMEEDELDNSGFTEER